MTVLSKTLHHIALLVVLSTTASILACTEKEENTSNSTLSIAVPVTPDKIKQLQNEAQAGDPDAQYNLAFLYEHGLGLPKDEAKALELYQNAADQGHSEAANNLDAMKSSK